MKNLLISILAVLTLAVSAQAKTLADHNREEFEMNHGKLNSVMLEGTELEKSRIHSIKCHYDFSKQGGAIGTLNLLDDLGQKCQLPNKAIIRDVLIDAVTTATGGVGATIALSSGQGAADLKAATGFASYTGLLAGIPVGSAATAIKLTADRNPTLAIATAALTAGKLNVHIQYQISE